MSPTAEVAADDSPLEGLAGQIFFWAMLFVLLIVPWMMARSPSGRAPPLTEDPSPGAASGSPLHGGTIVGHLRAS